MKRTLLLSAFLALATATLPACAYEGDGYGQPRVYVPIPRVEIRPFAHHRDGWYDNDRYDRERHHDQRHYHYDNRGD